MPIHTNARLKAYNNIVLELRLGAIPVGNDELQPK